MSKLSRRQFLKGSLIGGALASFPSFVRADYLPKFHPTPPEIEGPFYPVVAQKDKDFDLTQVEGKSGVAKGKIILIEGRVLDMEGTPLSDVTVDIWQANAAGRYRHPHDANTAPLDPNFQGWAIVPSGQKGGFRFKTVFPGAYPASADWTRPPHIHFKVSKRGYIDLTTQMYFPGHPLNGKDLLLKRKGPEEQKLMISEKIKGDPETYRYNIILQKA